MCCYASVENLLVIFYTKVFCCEQKAGAEASGVLAIEAKQNL